MDCIVQTSHLAEINPEESLKADEVVPTTKEPDH